MNTNEQTIERNHGTAALSDLARSQLGRRQWNWLLLGLFAGCGKLCFKSAPLPLQEATFPTQVSRFKSERVANGEIRRVVFALPLVQEKYADSTTQINQLLADALRSQCSIETILPTAREGFRCSRNMIEKGDYNEMALLRFAQRFNADAVAVTRIASFDPYWPMSISVSLLMVEVFDSTVAFSLDGHWKLTDRQTAADYATFVKSSFETVEQASADIYAQAPETFLKYVAAQIATEY
jgi:hypothetical protein